MAKRRNKSKEIDNANQVRLEIIEKTAYACGSYRAAVQKANEMYPEVPQWLKDKAMRFAKHWDTIDNV